MSLVDLSTIKDWLGITGNAHDTTLTLIRDAVEQSVMQFCETQFALTTVQNEILDGNRSDSVVTKNYPIVSVEAIYFDCNPDGTNGHLVDSSDYQVLPEAIVFKNYNTPFSRSAIRIDYTYGYDGVPSDVTLAIIQAVEAEFRRKARKSIGVQGRSKKDESETFKGDVTAWDQKTGLPKEVVYKLQPYKAFEFPVQPMATRNT